MIFADGRMQGFAGGSCARDIVRPQLERAMRNIDRRSAGIVWLNPHASMPGYTPTARGMRAPLPFVTLLTAASDARGFTALAKRLKKLPNTRPAARVAR